MVFFAQMPYHSPQKLFGELRLKEMFIQKDFDIDTVLCKPLMAHLSTVANGEPRDSPVWFVWEESSLWIFGTLGDSFIQRLKQEPRCAIGIVDFDLEKGILMHVGIRGTAKMSSIYNGRLRYKSEIT